MKLSSLIPTGRDRDIAATSQPFLSLQREVDRLFEDFGRGFASVAVHTAAGQRPSATSFLHVS